MECQAPLGVSTSERVACLDNAASQVLAVLGCVWLFWSARLADVPWVLAKWSDDKESRIVGQRAYLELGQSVDRVSHLIVGDEFMKDVFADIYRYLMQAGHRYGMLKKHDKNCHHSIERFEV